jgi:hypothetical protein
VAVNAKVGGGNKEICINHDSFVGKSLTFPNKQQNCGCVRITKRRQKTEGFVNNSEAKFLFVMDGGEDIVAKRYGWQTNNLKPGRPSKKKLKIIQIKIIVFLA